MLIEATSIRIKLHGIVARMAPPLLREDLMQEAMVHLWRAEEQDPGRDEVWYLHGCRMHLQNFLRLGRSVDSWKHFRRQALQWAETEDGGILPLPAEPTESLWDEVSVNDTMARLVQWLTPQEKDTLRCLMDGLSARETAKRLDLSHTMVNRHRSRIANLALKLGIAPSQTRRSVVRSRHKSSW